MNISRAYTAADRLTCDGAPPDASPRPPPLLWWLLLPPLPSRGSHSAWAGNGGHGSHTDTEASIAAATANRRRRLVCGDGGPSPPLLSDTWLVVRPGGHCVHSPCSMSSHWRQPWLTLALAATSAVSRLRGHQSTPHHATSHTRVRAHKHAELIRHTHDRAQTTHKQHTNNTQTTHKQHTHKHTHTPPRQYAHAHTGTQAHRHTGTHTHAHTRTHVHQAELSGDGPETTQRVSDSTEPRRRHGCAVKELRVDPALQPQESHALDSII